MGGTTRIEARATEARVEQAVEEPGRAGEPGQPGVPETDRDARCRLRDLSPRGLVVAGLLGLALLLAPAVALVHFLPDWGPTGDNALIALRAYDVGTARTPLTGQPSFSKYYGGDEHVSVDHPGALHFYLLAPFVRVLGPVVGMPLVSALVAGGVALTVAWVVFRQLGPRAGVIASALMALLMFARGAGPLTDPLSSIFSGYLLLATAVLVWALLCGDDRLLPLTAGVISFGVQIHLAVGPTMTLLAATAVAAVATLWWRAGIRHDLEVRRRALRLVGVTAGVAALLWLPPIVQQLFGNAPNLSALWEYVTDSGRDDLGGSVARDQLAHVLGWPPLWSDTQLDGRDLLQPTSPGTRWTAALTLAGLGLGGLWWRLRARATSDCRVGTGVHRRSLLALMVGVLVVAGYVNGSNVPVGVEAYRLEFYHWIWPLSFFVALAAVLLAADVGRWLVGHASRRSLSRLQPSRRTLDLVWTFGVGGVVALMVALPLANTQLDRRSNTLNFGMSTDLPRQVYGSLADQVMEQRDDIPSNVMLATRGGFVIGQHHAALALQLENRGLRVWHPQLNTGYVADGRIMDRDDVDAALVLRLGDDPRTRGRDGVGRQIARHETHPEMDIDAWADLVDQTAAIDRVALDPEQESYLATLPAEELLALTAKVNNLPDARPVDVLDSQLLDFLYEAPFPSSLIDPSTVEQVRADMDRTDLRPVQLLDMRVYLVTGDELDALLGR